MSDHCDQGNGAYCGICKYCDAIPLDNAETEIEFSDEELMEEIYDLVRNYKSKVSK